MCYCYGSEDKKHGSFEILGRERKEGDKSEASKRRGLRESQYVLNILFILF